MDKNIYIEDDYMTIARKIFELFDIGDIVQVVGYVTIDNVEGTVLAKGECVCEELYNLDKRMNVRPGGNRKQVKPEKSIGGFIAHKIFKYRIVINEGNPIYTIWRFQ